MLGQTGAHAGNVKPPVERPYEPFNRISRTQLILLLTARLERNRVAFEQQQQQQQAEYGASQANADSTGNGGEHTDASQSSFTDLPAGFDLSAFTAGNTVTVPTGYVTPLPAPRSTGPVFPPGPATLSATGSGSSAAAAAGGRGTPTAGRRAGTPLSGANTGANTPSSTGSALTKAARGRLTPVNGGGTGAMGATRTTAALRLPEGVSEDTVPLVIDVRESAEFAVGHLYGAASFPFLKIKRDQFSSEVWAFKNHEKRVVIVCS